MRISDWSSDVCSSDLRKPCQWPLAIWRCRDLRQACSSCSCISDTLQNEGKLRVAALPGISLQIGQGKTKEPHPLFKWKLGAKQIAASPFDFGPGSNSDGKRMRSGHLPENGKVDLKCDGTPGRAGK